MAPENSRAPLEVLREIGPVDIELTIHSIGFSDKFTKTLFVQFETNSAVQRLGDAIWKAGGTQNRYLIDPHLSLLYAKLPPENQAKTSRQDMAAISRSSFHLDLCDGLPSSDNEGNRSGAVEITRDITNKTPEALRSRRFPLIPKLYQLETLRRCKSFRKTTSKHLHEPVRFD
jgi:hypothetical protein